MSVYSGSQNILILFVEIHTFAYLEEFQEEESPLGILANLLTHQFSESSLFLWMTSSSALAFFCLCSPPGSVCL